MTKRVTDQQVRRLMKSLQKESRCRLPRHGAEWTKRLGENIGTLVCGPANAIRNIRGGRVQIHSRMFGLRSKRW